MNSPGSHQNKQTNNNNNNNISLNNSLQQIHTEHTYIILSHNHSPKTTSTLTSHHYAIYWLYDELTLYLSLLLLFE